MNAKIKSGTILTIGLLLLFCFFMISCDEAIPGSGKSIKETRNVNSFSRIVVSGAIKIVLTQASTEKVVIEADDNLMKYITTNVIGNTLEIDMKERVNSLSTIIAYISFKDLTYLDLSGACELTNNDTLVLQELSIDGSGASEFDLKMKLEKLNLDLSGASEIDLAGSAKTLIADLSGASDLSSDDFKVETASIDISGAGSARVYVTTELNASVSGAASVRYKGEPKLLTDISGAGSISPL